MTTATEIEDLIVALSVMRARLQPRLSYVRAEVISVASRKALMFPTFFKTRDVRVEDVTFRRVSDLLSEVRECITAPH